MSRLGAAAWTRISRKGSLSRELSVGAGGTFALKVTGLGISFLAAILLARLLGPAEYGIYAYAFAVVTLLAVPTTLGLPSLVVREMARYRAMEQWSLMRGLLVRVSQVVLVLSVGTAIVLGIVLWSQADRLGDRAVLTFGMALLLLPLLSLGAVRFAALRGLRHVVYGQAPETVVRPAVFLLALLLTAHFAGGEKMSAPLAMGLQVLGAAVAFLWGLYLLWKLLPKAARRVTPAFEGRRWIRSGIPFLLIGSMQVVNKNLDIVMLGWFHAPEDVGIYRAAVQIAVLITFGLAAINSVLAPHLANAWALADRERLQRLVTSSSRVILISSVPFGIAAIALGEQLISWTFGPPFIAAFVPLVILSIGQMVNAGAGSVGLVLNMTGHEKDAARAVAVATAANVALNLTLIPVYGMNGAAVATMASYVLWNGLMCLYVWRRTGIDSTALGWHRA